MSDSGSKPEPAETRAGGGPVPIEPPASPSESRRGTVPAKDPLRGSRASGIWVAVVAVSLARVRRG